MTIFDPMRLIALSQRYRLVRWLLGLHNFSLMPTEPGQDPVRRLQLRMLTTLTGILAFMLTLLALAMAGIMAALAQYRPAAWVLAVAGGAMLLLSGRSLGRSKSARMPTPGVLIITVALDLAAVIGGIFVLTR